MNNYAWGAASGNFTWCSDGDCGDTGVGWNGLGSYVGPGLDAWVDYIQYNSVGLGNSVIQEGNYSPWNPANTDPSLS